MSYKLFEKHEQISLMVIVIVISITLIIFVTTNFNAYSYNKGFYDGALSMCDENGVIIEDEKNVCTTDYMKENNIIYDGGELKLNYSVG